MIICHLVGTDRLSDEWRYLAQFEPSTLHQSSQTPPMLRHLNFYSSAKLSRTSTPDMPIRVPMPLLLQQQPQVPTQMCPSFGPQVSFFLNVQFISYPSHP